MPTYELPLLIRVMQKPELIAVLKRTAQSIFDKGGFIRRIDHLGTQNLPYKIMNNSASHWQASQFILHFDAPPSNLATIADEYTRDVDILKFAIYKQDEPTARECTLYEDLLPVPLRPTVKKMMEKVNKRNQLKARKGFLANVDYYPFQR